MIVHKSQTRSVASASAVTGLGALMPRLNMFGTVWRRGGELCLGQCGGGGGELSMALNCVSCSVILRGVPMTP